MLTLFGWLFRAKMVPIVLGVLCFMLLWWSRSRSLPEHDGTFEVAGIGAPLEIVRDHSSVPHIVGASDADVLLGLGYAHARDRLWQMIMMRRTVQGLPSELFGERTLPIDRLMRRLGLHTAARASLEMRDSPTREASRRTAPGSMLGFRRSTTALWDVARPTSGFCRRRSRLGSPPTRSGSSS